MLSFVVCWLLFGARCLFDVVRWVVMFACLCFCMELFVVWCVLFVACCLLWVVRCCMLFVVYCLLFVVCCCL